MAEQKKHKCWISLGSNLGDRKSNISAVLRTMEEVGIRILRKSGIYESVSWGYQSDNLFYNQCLLVETVFSAFELLEQFQKMERKTGRVEISGTYKDRSIDIDILFFDDLVVNSRNLIIPHPQMENRLFVLMPLNEIDPGKQHPLLKKPVSLLLRECRDVSEVHLVEKV